MLQVYRMIIAHYPNRNALVFGQTVVRVSAGGACMCLCILFDMYQVFFAQNSPLSTRTLSFLLGTGAIFRLGIYALQICHEHVPRP
jgi:hypothetical protein